MSFPSHSFKVLVTILELPAIVLMTGKIPLVAYVVTLLQDLRNSGSLYIVIPVNGMWCILLQNNTGYSAQERL